ncbi:MAG: hypothetical protein Q9214_002260 [Letrouitia sp. 1 TL-2023]
MIDQQFEDIEPLSLLLQHCSIDYITEDLLVQASRNANHLNYFLNHTLDHTISQSVLQSVGIGHDAYYPYDKYYRFETLFHRSECPPVHEEIMYIMIENWGGRNGSLSNVMNNCEPMYITDAYVQACAANTGVLDLDYVVSLHRAIPISKDATLSKNWDFLPISERSMVAAQRGRNDHRLFKFLLKHCDPIEDFLTDDVLLAAIENGNLNVVEYCIRKLPNFEVKEDFLKAAINGYSTHLANIAMNNGINSASHRMNNAILRILLAQKCQGSITRSVLETATERGKESALELLLKQPGLSELHQQVLNDILPNAALVGTDEETTFETIPSAASKLGELAREPKGSHEISTIELDILVSKYSGLSLDSNRLVEVAAQRKDGKFIVQYLLSRFPETIITQRALVAAARNEEALASLLDLLLVRRGSELAFEKLKGRENYVKWRGRMSAALNSAKLIGFISGKELPPDNIPDIDPLNPPTFQERMFITQCKKDWKQHYADKQAYLGKIHLMLADNVEKEVSETKSLYDAPGVEV